MNIQDLLANPQIIEQVARSVGVGDSDARAGLESLFPAVAQGINRNGRSSAGIESLAKALGSGSHDRYLDHPETLGEARTRVDGNAILGHTFDSKDVSRNVAAQAAETTGLDSSMLKQMLPIVASIAMAALSKQSGRGAELGRSAGNQAGGADLLGSLLGGLLGGGGSRPAQNDSALDDVLDLAKKFF